MKAMWGIAGSDVATTKDVADRLSVAPASVTNMFTRLREMGLVEYERYHGASLTEAGCTEALRLVRSHRLIETFLMEHRGYSWDDVHDEANAWSTQSPTSSPSAWLNFWGIPPAIPTEIPFQTQTTPCHLRTPTP